MPQIFVNRRAEIVTFSRLLQVAKWSLHEARDHDEGSFHNLTSSMVFSAFAIEAFLNHAGERLVRDWNKYDRNSVHGKLRLVCKQVGVVADREQEPFKTFVEMVDFRNMLAHGRTRVEHERRELTDGPRQYPFERLLTDPIGDWEKGCTITDAERFLECARSLLSLIRSRSPVPLPGEGELGHRGASETTLNTP